MMISKFALNNVMKHGDDNNSSTCQFEYTYWPDCMN